MSPVALTTCDCKKKLQCNETNEMGASQNYNRADNDVGEGNLKLSWLTARQRGR